MDAVNNHVMPQNFV